MTQRLKFYSALSIQPFGARHSGISHKVNLGLTLCAKPFLFVMLRFVNLGLTKRVLPSKDSAASSTRFILECSTKRTDTHTDAHTDRSTDIMATDLQGQEITVGKQTR